MRADELDVVRNRLTGRIQFGTAICPSFEAKRPLFLKALPMFRFFENLVDPYVAYEEKDRPPQRLWPFIWDYCKPFRKIFAVTGALTILVAMIEVWLIAYMGRLVDLLASADRATFWEDYGFEMVAIGVALLILRPLIQLFDVGLLNNTILPNFGTFRAP